MPVCAYARFDGVDVQLADLPRGIVAIVLDTVRFKHSWVEGGEKRSCTVKPTQLPIVPAMAITAHTAQGKTMAAAVVDLHGGGARLDARSCYVALSRVRRLSSLALLREFPLGVLQRPPPESMLAEVARLQALAVQ